MIDALLTLVDRLRQAMVAVSMSEVVDAAAALEHLDVLDRRMLKIGLRTVLIKRAEDEAVYSALFDACFAPSPGPVRDPDAAMAPPGVTAPSDLVQALLIALHANDDAAMAGLAAMAVDRFGGKAEGRSHRYLLYRVVRALDLSNLQQRAQREAEAAVGDDPWERRSAREEIARRIENLRRLVAEEIERRGALHSRPTQGDADLPTPIRDLAFEGASATEVRELRRALAPLARKLAARIAQRRRLQRRGRLDVRKTVHRSMSSGGVLLDVALKRPHATRPELYVLCDVSGSVGDFAMFTLMFLTAMNEEFSRLRSFAFVDGVGEVTNVFGPNGYPPSPYHLLSRPGVVTGHGHSDYGEVFTQFWETYGAATLTNRSTLIITGDARNHDRPDGADKLGSIERRARRVYWLNPEPRSEWDTGDSIMSTYARSCTAVFEVRNLSQLGECIYAIA